MPAAEVEIDEDLVRHLLISQAEPFADLPLVRARSGWDNEVWRLGDDWAVRIPRRELGADLVANEARWLPVLAPKLPTPVPSPVFVGRPEGGFPWPWTVVPWFDGDTGASAELSAAGASRLGSFLAALHSPAPVDAPENRFRGVPLADRRDRFEVDVVHLSDRLNVDAVTQRWEELVATPPFTGQPVWLHGDLHLANIIVRDGDLQAVIDFGDITSGDPAVDLAVGWNLGGDGCREAFLDAYGAVGDDTKARAQAWLLALAVAYLAHSDDDQTLVEMSHRALRRVVGDSWSR